MMNSSPLILLSTIYSQLRLHHILSQVAYLLFYKSLVRGTPCSCGLIKREEFKIQSAASVCLWSQPSGQGVQPYWSAGTLARVRCPLQTVAGPIIMVLCGPV